MVDSIVYKVRRAENVEDAQKGVVEDWMNVAES
jgi:hypothetical protein